MTISFNTKGYDEFIDFIKAYAIICVLLGHTFLWLDKIAYGVWAGMQVPLFILVQAFHTYKKDNHRICLTKIFRRVLLPFVVIELITFGLSVLFLEYDCTELIDLGLKRGGYGPGAYYPWIYIQIALLLPFLGLVLKKCSRVTALIVFFVISEGFEVLCSWVNFPDTVYRVLCVRYFFLLYLGWLWVKEGIIINGYTISLSLLSLFSIIYFEYFSIDDQPWFYSTSWKYHRWPCYFFVANGLTALLYIIYNSIKNRKIISKCVKHLAESSYEIFLIQMSLIWLFGFKSISFINRPLIQYIVWCSLIWTASILGGVLLNKLVNNLRSSSVKKK